MAHALSTVVTPKFPANGDAEYLKRTIRFKFVGVASDRQAHITERALSQVIVEGADVAQPMEVVEGEPYNAFPKTVESVHPPHVFGP